MKLVEGGNGSRTEKLAEWLAENYDLEMDSELEDLAHDVLGILAGVAMAWNPYAVIGLMQANARHILQEIEEEA